MILYFTGTGNSKYIADALADRLDEEVVSLNDVIKNNKEKSFSSERPFVVVAPIYAWRLPQIVEELVATAEFKGSKDIYFVATMGSETGNCDKYCKKIAGQAGLDFKGFRGIVMPNNYVVASVMDDEATNDAIVAAALPRVDEIAEAVREKREICKTDKTFLAGFLSGFVNKGFTGYMCSAKSYVVSDECISCGKCVGLCPLNNVTMSESGKPVFGKKCINCFACLQYCPKQAINIPNKTENHGRYTCKEWGKH